MTPSAIDRLASTTHDPARLGNQDHDRSTTMYHLHEEQVRAQIDARLGEAQEMQRAARYLHVRRSVRRAERAAARARLALARSL